MHPDNIIIKQPLVNLSSLGITDNEYTVFEEETFLPKLLVKHGFFKSLNEIKKNRFDLWKELSKPNMEKIKIGKRFVWLIIGE